MFRGNKSSNRIELSQLVQWLIEFSCFGFPVALGKGQVGGGLSGGMGSVPTHVYMYAHTHTCTYAHVYMYRNCKWLPPWRHPCLSCLTCMCACVYMHVCVVHGAPPTPTPIYPHTTPRGRTTRIRKKFNNTWTNQDNFILFKDLKSVENPPPMGGCMVWWVDGWGEVKLLKLFKMLT